MSTVEQSRATPAVLAGAFLGACAAGLHAEDALFGPPLPRAGAIIFIPRGFLAVAFAVWFTPVAGLLYSLARATFWGRRVEA